MSDMNFEQARFNMIEQQIRTWEVLDQRVLDTFARLPREDFVPERYRKLAFADVSIPLAHDQCMMPPKLEGRLLQALAVQPDDRVLEIGTGSGFLTACLAQLGASVTSVEFYPDLSAGAAQQLAAHGIRNVELTVGDAAAGWDQGPYDVIAITGSLPVYHPAFEAALAVGGRLFVVVGTPPVMEALLVTRVDAAGCTRTSLFETDLPALVNAMRPQPFVL